MSNINVILKNLGRSLNKNSPVILTAFSVIGVVTTAVMASKATLIAEELYYEKQLKDFDELRDLTIREKVETAWKVYLPSVLMGGLTISSILGAHKIQAGRITTMVGLYSIAETQFKELQSKMVEVVGERKAQLINEEIDQDRIDNNPDTKTLVVVPGTDYPCYDKFSDRYFQSDITKLDKAQNAINKRLLNDMEISLNDVYHEMGLPPVDYGEKSGFSVDRHLLEFRYTTKIANESQPCLVVSFTNDPVQLW